MQECTTGKCSCNSSICICQNAYQNGVGSACTDYLDCQIGKKFHFPPKIFQHFYFFVSGLYCINGVCANRTLVDQSSCFLTGTIGCIPGDTCDSTNLTCVQSYNLGCQLDTDCALELTCSGCDSNSNMICADPLGQGRSVDALQIAQPPCFKSIYDAFVAGNWNLSCFDASDWNNTLSSCYMPIIQFACCLEWCEDIFFCILN